MKMKSLADGLPPEIAKEIHPEWRANEVEYWSVRDQLLEQYRDQWIGFARGKVVAHGTSPVEVFHAAMDTGLHPYFTCVGREYEPCRMRRAVFPYDSTYPGEPLPILQVEFRTQAGLPGIILGDVIPDTGADGSTLPWRDCQLLHLDPAKGIPGLMVGVSGPIAQTVLFQIWARLDGVDYPCRLQANYFSSARILGRDVLKHLNILFRGPAKETIINP